MLSAVSSLVSRRVNTHSIHTHTVYTHTQQGFIQRGKGGGYPPPILNVSPSNRKRLYAIFRNRAKFRDWLAYYYLFLYDTFLHFLDVPIFFPPQAENPAWIPAQCTHTHTHCANTQCTHTHTLLQCTCTHTVTHFPAVYYYYNGIQ